MTPDQQLILDKVEADFQLIQAVEDAFARALPFDYRAESEITDFVQFGGYIQTKDKFEADIDRLKLPAEYVTDKMSCFREVIPSSHQYKFILRVSSIQDNVVNIIAFDRFFLMFSYAISDPNDITLDLLLDFSKFSKWLSNKILGVE